MSARDDLDKFDRDWERHLEWRLGGRRHMGGDPERAGKYLEVERATNRVVLAEMPEAVRAAVLKDFEAALGALVDAKRSAIRAELVKAAKEEAQRTLEMED